MKSRLQLHGAGVSFLAEHFTAIMADPQRLDFVEIQTERLFSAGPMAQRQILALRQCLPLSVHDTRLSLGGLPAPDDAHVRQLSELCRRFQPAVVSVRLGCAPQALSPLGSHQALAFNPRTLQRLVEQVDQVQTALARPLLIENPPAFLPLADSHMHEADFLRELSQRSGCGLLLDIGNLLISCHNGGGTPEDYLQRLPAQQIGEIRLSGYSPLRLESGRCLLVDEHAGVIADATWDLYAMLLRDIGQRPTVVEWSRQLLSWMVLAAEVDCVRALQHFPFMPA